MLCNVVHKIRPANFFCLLHFQEQIYLPDNLYTIEVLEFYPSGVYILHADVPLVILLFFFVCLYCVCALDS